MSGSSPILKAALLGRSLGHSISPALHQALFPLLREHTQSDYTGIEYEAIECETAPDMFGWVAAARKAGYTGANVTYPYKQIAAEALARPSKLVRKIHSANVLRFGTLLHSESSDGAGFLTALRRKTSETFAGFDLIVIGAGGAARAILWHLHDLPFASITVAARDEARAEAVKKIVPTVQISAIDNLSRRSNPALVIQATPVGQQSSENMVPNFEWRKSDVAADLVYRPLQTSFFSAAKSAGATTIDGLGMLIEQAAFSQMFWLTGTLPQHSPLTERQFHALWDQFSTELK